jgi:hypothetical protein
MLYAIEQRLRFIDFLLMEYGYFNRSALMNFFGVSSPQASTDIKAYLELAPGNATYDGNAKTYRKTPGFRPFYEKDAPAKSA